MTDRHLTASEILDVLSEGAGLKEADAMKEHLMTCAGCRQLLASTRSQDDEEGSVVGHDNYARVLDRVFDSILLESDGLETERITAPSLRAELSTFSLSQQKLLIHNSPRYQVWALAEEFLAECRAGWGSDPGLSEGLAFLALEVCGRVRVSGFRQQLLSDLKAEAWSYIGNCRRISSDLRGSQEAFRRAEGHLAAGSGDLLERARVFDLKASLLGSQRKYAAGIRLLSEVIDQYQRANDTHQEGRALIKKAKLLRDAGDAEMAVPLLERAAGLLDGERDHRLFFALRHNMLVMLTDLGRLGEAQALIPETRDLARKYASRHDRLRLLWTEGLLRQKLGQHELAEEALQQVRDGFIAAEIGFDVAQVSLDLAALYLETGRNHRVRELAVETMPLFASRDAQRDLTVAWSLLCSASERDAVTTAVVDEVATKLRAARGTFYGAESSP